MSQVLIDSGLNFIERLNIKCITPPPVKIDPVVKLDPSSSDGYYHPRETQTSKIYRAEREAFDGTVWEEIIGDGSIEDARDYIDEIMDSNWFRNRWGTKTPIVIPNERGTWNYSTYDDYIQLCPSGRIPWVIFHEISHYLSFKPGVQGHGPEFAAHYLFLVRKVAGPVAARLLRDNYELFKVRYKEGADSIPPSNPEENNPHV